MEEEISWKLDEYPDILSIDGIISNEEKQQSIMLTHTANYFNAGNPAAVSGALVTVTEGNIVYTYTESSINPGLYVSDDVFAGEPSKSYELFVQLEEPINGVSDFATTTVMPQGIVLDNIMCEVYDMPQLDIPGDDEERDSTILGIYYFGFEPVDQENYYLARIFSNEIPLQSNAKELLTFNDEYSNGNYSDFLLYIDNVMPDDLIRFRIISVEKAYYDFINDLKMIDDSGNAYNMSGPPANAIGNIPNALGFFTAVFASEKTGIAVDMR
jgi:hypothetical protein